jgi:hypothetical protein
MLNSIRNLNSFTDSNIQNLLTNIKVEKHPINRDNVRKWLALYPRGVGGDSDVGREYELGDYIIAKTIANNIMNVSYDEIMFKMNMLANELFIIYTITKPNLYLYLPTELKKSNFVFTIIFYHFCRMKGIEFSGVTSTYNTHTSNKMIVIVDDASYSGDQIYNHIHFLKWINPKETTHYFLAISYISDTAIRLFNSNFIDLNIIIPTSSTIFKSIRSLLNKEELEIVERMPTRKHAIHIEYLIDKNLLYLDFKLPDSLSIPQTIFAYGYKIGDPWNKTYSDPNEVLSFIGGCEETFKNNLQINKRVGDINREKLVGGTCPVSFYKNIEWIRKDEKEEKEEKDENLEKKERAYQNYILEQYGVSDPTKITSLIVSNEALPNFKCLSIFNRIIRLEITDSYIRDLSDIPHFPRLTELLIRNSSLENISSIIRYPNLIKIVLDRNKITEIPDLSTLTKLTDLSLTGNLISDLTPIENCLDLRSLSLSDNRIEDLSPISKLSKLSTISISNNRIRYITKLVNLKYISIDGNLIENIDNILNTDNFPSLKNLSVSNNRIENINMNMNSNIYNNVLSDLSINGNNIRDLSFLTNIKYLRSVKIDRQSSRKIIDDLMDRNIEVKEV